MAVLAARKAVPRELVQVLSWEQQALENCPESSPSLEKLHVMSDVHTERFHFSPWVLTLPLVFHRDWWKQKPKPFPWKTRPSFQRALYRKDTDYGSATWTPKSQSKSRSLSWWCAEVQCLLQMLRRLFGAVLCILSPSFAFRFLW